MSAVEDKGVDKQRLSQSKEDFDRIHEFQKVDRIREFQNVDRFRENQKVEKSDSGSGNITRSKSFNRS